MSNELCSFVGWLAFFAFVVVVVLLLLLSCSCCCCLSSLSSLLSSFVGVVKLAIVGVAAALLCKLSKHVVVLPVLLKGLLHRRCHCAVLLLLLLSPLCVSFARHCSHYVCALNPSRRCVTKTTFGETAYCCVDVGVVLVLSSFVALLLFLPTLFFGVVWCVVVDDAV